MTDGTERDQPLESLIFRTQAVLVLAAMLGALVPIGGLLHVIRLFAEVGDQTFASIDQEERVHRAAWGVEVAARHAVFECLDTPSAEPGLRDRLATADAALERELTEARGKAPETFLHAASGYHHFAEDAIREGVCLSLTRGEMRRRRLKLDEELTNAWIERIHDLDDLAEAGEQNARRVGLAVGLAGALVAVLVLVFAVRAARRAATRIADPLEAAARAAEAVGAGSEVPVVEAGGIAEVRSLTRAIERMRLDLEATDRAKQSFLASVSHELRTPLAKVREALALLGDGSLGALNDRQQRVVTLARRACEAEVRLVVGLLDLSRLSSGSPIRIREGVALEAIVNAAVSAEADAAQERGVKVTVSLDGRPVKGSFDTELVERAVANLIRNAVSVSARGGAVAVEIAFDTAGAGATVRVVDDGPGLPEALRSDPFRPFVASAVSSTRGPGIGLGLTLAREVARAHGGDLVVERTDARGTVFALALRMTTG